MNVELSIVHESRGDAAQWTVSAPGAVAELTYTDSEVMAAIALKLIDILYDARMAFNRGEGIPMEPSDPTKGLLE